MALFLRDKGYRAWALTGGYSAWREGGHPMDSKDAQMARTPDNCPECGRPWNVHSPTT